MLFFNSQASCEVVKTFHLEHPGTSCVEIRRDQKLFVSGGWDHRQATLDGWRQWAYYCCSRNVPAYASDTVEAYSFEVAETGLAVG